MPSDFSLPVFLGKYSMNLWNWKHQHNMVGHSFKGCALSLSLLSEGLGNWAGYITLIWHFVNNHYVLGIILKAGENSNDKIKHSPYPYGVYNLAMKTEHN